MIYTVEKTSYTFSTYRAATRGSFDPFSLDLFLIPEKVVPKKSRPLLAEILWPPLNGTLPHGNFIRW